MANPREPFEPDTIYHVYNHGNGDELIFREGENYRFFLDRFKVYISHIAWIYAYCLMPNHFHFLIRVKDEKELVNYFKEKYPGNGKSLSRERSAMSQKDIADLIRFSLFTCIPIKLRYLNGESWQTQENLSNLTPSIMYIIMATAMS